MKLFERTFVFFYIAASAVVALDVKLQGIECDNSLPITMDMYMTCANGARCTFGKDVKIYGTSTSLTEIDNRLNETFITYPLFR